MKNVVSGLPRKDYFASGSILEIITDPSHPVMAGMPDRARVFADGSPVFTTLDGFEGSVLAKYQKEGSPRVSGYLLGEKYLQGYAAAVDVKHGRGHVDPDRLPAPVARAAVRHVPRDLQRDDVRPRSRRSREGRRGILERAEARREGPETRAPAGAGRRPRADALLRLRGDQLPRFCSDAPECALAMSFGCRQMLRVSSDELKRISNLRSVRIHGHGEVDAIGALAAGGVRRRATKRRRMRVRAMSARNGTSPAQIFPAVDEHRRRPSPPAT